MRSPNGDRQIGTPVARYNRKDHLYQRAKREGLRSRAAYKLEEVQKSYKLLSKGQRVFDLGCWPGGWLELAAGLVGPHGRVVGVDRAELDPVISLAQATAFIGDLEAADIADHLREHLGTDRADVVLSDAAPKLTGIRETDRANEERLLESIEGLLPQLLRVGGALLIKLLESPEAQVIDRRIRARFDRAKTLKLAATRKGSRERYLIAWDYRGDATPIR